MSETPGAPGTPGAPETPVSETSGAEQRFYVQAMLPGQDRSLTQDELERWLEAIAAAVASRDTDVMEIAICSDDDAIARDPALANSRESCRSKLVVVMNVNPCRGKLLDPEMAAEYTAFTGPGRVIDRPGG